MAKAVKKDTGKISLAPRAKKVKKARNPLFLDEKYTGPEPEWTGWEKWSFDKFRKEKHRGHYYYNYFNNSKDMIPAVIEWMGNNGYSKEDIRAYKEMPDWKTGTTMGSLATMLNRGMPTKHPESEDRDSTEWLNEQLLPLVAAGKELLIARKADEKKNANLHVPTIQERIKEATYIHMEPIDEWLEAFITDPENFNPKSFNVISYFKTNGINQAHARIIRDKYAYNKEDYDELLAPPKVKDDAYTQLVEAYSCYTKAQQKNMQSALNEILSACDMFLQQAKVNRKVRAKKASSKEKLVAKLKYKLSDDRYKLVSMKPEDCLQALEIWVFNTKTRKLGCYVASDTAALSVKGTTIINFNEAKSKAKTVRKPEELFKDSSSLPKTKMRKLYDSINSVETLLNGRINTDMILLKAYT
jgi:hypothetical protein